VLGLQVWRKWCGTGYAAKQAHCACSVP